MKTITNRETKITEQVAPGSNETRALGFADLAIICLNIPPERGWTMTEMRERLNIEAKLRGAEFGAKIKLEDAEFNKILQCSNLNWSVKHEDIVAFGDHLEEMSKK